MVVAEKRNYAFFGYADAIHQRVTTQIAKSEEVQHKHQQVLNNR